MKTLVNYQNLEKELDFMLILFFKKNEYFKVEAAKINQTVINKRTI